MSLLGYYRFHFINIISAGLEHQPKNLNKKSKFSILIEYFDIKNNNNLKILTPNRCTIIKINLLIGSNYRLIMSRKIKSLLISLNEENFKQIVNRIN